MKDIFTQCCGNISGEEKGGPFFYLSLLGCIFLRFGLMGGNVAFSSTESGRYKKRNLNFKILSVFGQLVLKKFDKRLHCLFLSICICKYKIFLLCLINFFHCIPPSLDMGGNKWSSFLLIGDHLSKFIYFIRFLHSGHGDILCTCSFLFTKVLCFVFVFWPLKIYFWKLVIHSLFLWKSRAAHFWSLASPQTQLFSNSCAQLTFQNYGRRKISDQFWVVGGLLNVINSYTETISI